MYLALYLVYLQLFINIFTNLLIIYLSIYIMKKSLLKKALIALVLLTGVLPLAAQAVMPQLSDGTTSYWYHIVFQRYSANLALQDNGDGATLTTASLVLNQDNQLWKVEAGALANQYVLTSKAGRKVYWDGVSRFKAGTTTTGINLVATTNTTYPNSWELQRDGSTTMAMNPVGGSSAGKEIGEWNLGDGGNPVKFVSVKGALLLKITEATNKLTNTMEGADPGKFTAASRTALQDAITAAQGVHDNTASVDTDYLTTIASLTTAIATYNSAVIVPVLSTEGNERWYFIQGTRPANTYITDDPASINLPDAPVIPNDTQLWKFVANTNGTANGFALVNKATGEFINTDLANNTKLTSIATMPANNLQFVASDIYTNKVARFWLENAAGSNPALRFHAGGSGHNNSLMNYTGDRYDNSSWLILDYAVALKTFLQNAITDAQNALTIYPEGAYFGQNSAADRTTLSNAIAAAQAIYDNPASTETAIKDATATTNAATTVYKTAAKNTQKLVSLDSQKYRYYRLVNRNYTTNNIVTTNGVAENGGIVAQDAETSTDHELWRFIPNTEGTSVKIVNKATGLAIKENGTSTQSTLVNLSTASDFLFTAVDSYWGISPVDIGNGFKYLHRDGSSKLVGWELSAAASQWTLQFVEEAAIPLPRTITVSTADTQKGTAAIVGSTETSVTTAESVTVKPIPTPGFIFSKWTDATTDAEVSTEPQFTYKGSADVELKANFVELGTLGMPMISDDTTPIYYYIQSASDGSHVFSSFTGDFRNNVLIAPTVAGKIIHNKLSAATTNDHALWQVVKVDEVTLLKNKATGWYMNGSHSVGTLTTTAYSYTLVEGTTHQYVMKTSDQTSYTNAWKLNLCDRLSLVTTPNSMMAWIFVVEPGSLANYSLTTGTDNTSNTNITIRTTNRVITVDGVDNFEVYSISGQRINPLKAVESGFYIVKIGTKAMKIQVN